MKKLGSVLALVLALALVLPQIFTVLPVPAEAKTSAELKDELDRLEEEQDEINKKLEDLKDKLSDNLDDMKDVVARKDIIDQEIATLYEKTNNINQQIIAYSDLIADKQEELDEAEAQLAELREKNRARIRAMEEEGNISYWEVLFEAKSFSDFLDRLNMVEEIAAADRRRLDEMSAATKVVEGAKDELVSSQQLLADSKLELEEAQEEQEKKRTEAEALLTQLIATGEEYEKYVSEAEEEESAINIKVDNVEQLYEDAKYKEWMANNVTKPGGSTVNGLTWIKPTAYTRVSSPFGYRIHPVYGDWRFHNGIDLAASSGTPIYATRSGKVTVAQYSSSAGYYVTLNHQDGFESKYLHMTHYIVKVGDYVAAGDVIGYVGSTGTSTGAHLHFTIVYNGKYVNPADYIYF